MTYSFSARRGGASCEVTSSVPLQARTSKDITKKPVAMSARFRINIPLTQDLPSLAFPADESVEYHAVVSIHPRGRDLNISEKLNNAPAV
jgi:hypothetical protein